MSWAKIAIKNTPNITIKNQVVKAESIPQNLINFEDTSEDIFYIQTGTYLLDFISDLKYSFDKYYGSLLGKMQPHNIYEFFNKYINFELSIKIPNKIIESDLESDEYEDYILS